MTIDRTVVHKSVQSEVFVTSVEDLGADRWRCGIAVPRGHWKNWPVPATLPLITGAELVRQAGMAVCALGYGIPADSAFTIQELEFKWTDVPPAFPRFTPLTAEATIQVSDGVLRKGALSALTLDYRFGDFATARATTRILSRKDYGVIRRNAPTAGAAEPRHDGDILRPFLDPLHGLVGWDERDPFFFDHAVDHVPGMLLTEVVVRAFTRLRDEQPTSVKLIFERFAELAAGTEYRISESGGAVSVEFIQDGVRVASGLASAQP